MFSVPKGYALSQEIQKAEANYLIQKNDLLQLEVYTNRGEKIIDPNLSVIQGSDQPGESTSAKSYLVREDGTVKFPLITDLKLEGLTLTEAESVLQTEYSKYYQEPFVRLNYSNKRVIILGALGGQVIPLMNENIKLTEILALAKGIDVDAKANNIRVLRGDDVFLIDLTTIQGYKTSNILIRPNDIIYIEPVRRPVIEALRDYGPVLSIVSTLTTVVVLIVSLNNSN